MVALFAVTSPLALYAPERLSWNQCVGQLGWEHINLVGNYHFAPQPDRDLSNLRPLRLEESQQVEEVLRDEESVAG